MRSEYPPIATVDAALLIKLRTAQQAYNDRPTQPDIVHKSILATFVAVGKIEESRCLHGSGP